MKDIKNVKDFYKTLDKNKVTIEFTSNTNDINFYFIKGKNLFDDYFIKEIKQISFEIPNTTIIEKNKIEPEINRDLEKVTLSKEDISKKQIEILKDFFKQENITAEKVREEIERTTDKKYLLKKEQLLKEKKLKQTQSLPEQKLSKEFEKKKTDFSKIEEIKKAKEDFIKDIKEELEKEKKEKSIFKSTPSVPKKTIKVIDTAEYKKHFSKIDTDNNAKNEVSFQIISMSSFEDKISPYCVFITSREEMKKDERYLSLLNGGGKWSNARKRENDYKKFVLDKYLTLGDPIQVCSSENSVVYFLQEGPNKPYFIPENPITITIYDNEGNQAIEVQPKEYKFEDGIRLQSKFFPDLAIMLSKITNALCQEKQILVKMGIRHLDGNSVLIKFDTVSDRKFFGVESGWTSIDKAIESSGISAKIKIDFANFDIKVSGLSKTFKEKLTFY